MSIYTHIMEDYIGLGCIGIIPGISHEYPGLHCSSPQRQPCGRPPIPSRDPSHSACPVVILLVPRWHQAIQMTSGSGPAVLG